MSLSDNFEKVINSIYDKYRESQYINNGEKKDDMYYSYRTLINIICSFKNIICDVDNNYNNYDKNYCRVIFDNIYNNWNIESEFQMFTKSRNDMLNSFKLLNGMGPGIHEIIENLIKCFSFKWSIPKSMYKNIQESSNIENTIIGKLIELRFTVIAINTYMFWKHIPNKKLLIKYNSVLNNDLYRYEYVPNMQSFNENLLIVHYKLIINAHKKDLIKIMSVMDKIYKKYQDN